MTRQHQQFFVPRQYPLLYWTALIYLVGVPNFLHFDVTGRTHTQGIFNLTSICQIAIAIISAYVLSITLLLERRPAVARKLGLGLSLWIPLLLLFVLATLYSPTDRIISLYRLGEWVIAFGLIRALYSRSPTAEATPLLIQMIGRVSWIWICIVWTVLPVLPSQAYGTSDELASKIPQLGGQLISPSYLATLSIAAFFYALFFFPKGLFRVAGCLLCAATIFLAHTRIEQISLLFLILVYCLFFSSKLLRVLTITCFVIAVPVIVALRDIFLLYFSRGQALKTLLTLNDRTFVWQAAIEAGRERPILGYGFLAGARNAIRDHWHYTNWLPPHAHNEYLQAFLSGGAIAVFLVVLIYARGLWLSMTNCRRGPHFVLLFFLMLLLTIRSIGGSNFTTPYTRVGALFLLTFIGIIACETRALTRQQNSPGKLHVGQDLSESTV